MLLAERRWAWVDEFLTRQKWAGLAATFVVFLVAFSLMLIDLVHQIRDERGYSGFSVWLGIGIAALLAVGLTLLQLGLRRRGMPAAARLLGLTAWQEGLLPLTEPERGLAIKDLRRRERSLTSGSPVAIAVIWTVITAFQILISTSALHTAAWILICLLFVSIAINSVVQRRHLYQLQDLLAEGDDAQAS